MLILIRGELRSLVAAF